MERYKIEVEFSAESWDDAHELFDQMRIDYENSKAYQVNKYLCPGARIRLTLVNAKKPKGEK